MPSVTDKQCKLCGSTSWYVTLSPCCDHDLRESDPFHDAPGLERDRQLSEAEYLDRRAARKQVEENDE